jgi:hypothetical protein
MRAWKGSWRKEWYLRWKAIEVCLNDLENDPVDKAG